MLTLAAGASSLVVAPEYGAGLTGWMIGRTPMLRRALPQSTIGGDPHAMACFPLLPYGNRIGSRRFGWRGRNYTLAANFTGHPHTIHGVGWQRPWTVTQVGPGRVVLALCHRPDPHWPFAFDAELGYHLTEQALTVTLAMTSRHDTEAPGGIGLHPYFPKTNHAALRFNATGAWHNGPDSLPSCHGPLPAEWLHTTPRAVADSRLDTCFTGWDGTADISAGPASLRIEACPVFAHLQVFTPSWADFFCVEPVSHMPDAINRHGLPPDQAMRVLQPNETLQGAVRFTPTA